MSVSPNHNDKIQDSLDNLPNNKLRLSSLDKFRTLQAQVKQKYFAALEKLQSSETRQIAIAQIRKLVDHHREPEHLRNYISILKNLKPNTVSSTKEHQVLVVSILAQIFKENLLDPLDKPPSLLKSVFRLVEILHGYFADKNATVQQACARALMDLCNCCLFNQNSQTIFSLIISPLVSILKTGVDKASQGTAAVCLNELIIYWKKTQRMDLFDNLSKDLLSVIFKINSEYNELFNSIGLLIEIKGMSFFEGRIVSFFNKVLPVINGTRDNSSNFNSYMCKVNVCKIVEKIGLLLDEKEKQQMVDLNILQSLEKASRNRIIQVQMAAARASKAWKGQTLERQNTPSKVKGLMSLEEMRNNKKLQRSNSQEGREKMENQLTFMKEDLQKMVKGGWGANNRAKNYVKRGSGVGGGFQGKLQHSPTQKNNKSHKQHIEQLRQIIKKGTQQNRNVDRFSYAPDKNQSKNVQKDKASPQISSQKVRNSPQTKKIYPKKKQVLEMQDFQQQLDEGVQNIAPSFRKTNQNARRQVQKTGMKQKEVDQLLKQEKNLMQAANQMNINFNIEHPSQQKQQQSMRQQHPQNALDWKTHVPHVLKQDSRTIQNQKPRQMKQPQQNPQKNQRTKMSDDGIFKPFSQEQIGDLVNSCNLSDVSENLDNLLNESDLMQAGQKSDLLDSGILPHSNNNGKSEIQSIKQIVNEKKNTRNSRLGLLSKFTKNKQSVLEETPLIISEMPPVKKQIVPEHSLAFTQSINSPNKSPERYINQPQQQFTLNPAQNNRFSTLKQPSKQQNNINQIQQQIVMSVYQQSVPKEQNFPIKIQKPVQLPPVLPRKQQTKFTRQVDMYEINPVTQNKQQMSKQYQKMIKNPPKVYEGIKHSRLTDKRSNLSEQLSKENQPEIEKQTDQDDPITLKWLQILKSIKTQDYNYAYDLAFEMDDPIYLLRLMLMTKCPIKKLTTANATLLWQKFMEIYNHHFVDVLFVHLFGQAQQLNSIKSSLNVQQLQELLLQLYEISGTTKGKISFNAANLYNEIQGSMKSKKPI